MLTTLSRYLFGSVLGLALLSAIPLASELSAQQVVRFAPRPQVAPQMVFNNLPRGVQVFPQISGGYLSTLPLGFQGGFGGYNYGGYSTSSYSSTQYSYGFGGFNGGFGGGFNQFNTFQQVGFNQFNGFGGFNGGGFPQVGFGGFNQFNGFPQVGFNGFNGGGFPQVGFNGFNQFNGFGGNPIGFKFGFNGAAGN